MRKKIGRSEIISLPDFEISNISAKVDTGACGVALHVDSIILKNNKLYFTIDDKNFTYNDKSNEI